MIVFKALDFFLSWRILPGYETCWLNCNLSISFQIVSRCISLNALDPPRAWFCSGHETCICRFLNYAENWTLNLWSTQLVHFSTKDYIKLYIFLKLFIQALMAMSFYSRPLCSTELLNFQTIAFILWLSHTSGRVYYWSTALCLSNGTAKLNSVNALEKYVLDLFYRILLAALLSLPALCFAPWSLYTETENSCMKLGQTKLRNEHLENSFRLLCTGFVAIYLLLLEFTRTVSLIAVSPFLHRW